MLKRLMVVASLALIAAAVMAAPALAATKWNAEGGFTMKGTLTLKKAGASPVSCTISSTAFAANGEERANFSTINTPEITKCANGKSWSWVAQGAVDEAGTFSYLGSCCGIYVSAPWENRTYLGAAEPTFVNGSGLISSHIDFKETEMGKTNFGEKVTVSGELKVARGGGGLLTWSEY